MQSSLRSRLILAAALMIARGCPVEMTPDNLTRGIFGLLSAHPFACIF
ncbi:hypothetical protein [Cryobacterium serini]|nr:hypothetical protein [Cryobacterium serini]